jgi:hypothetical protein
MTRELKRSRDETFKMNADGVPINKSRRPPSGLPHRPIAVFPPFSIPILIAVPAAARDTLERAECGSIAVACRPHPM